MRAGSSRLERLQCGRWNPRRKGEEVVGARGRNDPLHLSPYHFQRGRCSADNFICRARTLLMLVSAFAGREFLLRAYEEAIRDAIASSATAIAC